MSKPQSSGDIARSLAIAGVPRSCWPVSTTATGRMPYRDFAEEVKQRATNREAQTAAYLKFKDAAGILDAEMVAKEMVLAGVRTRYTPFYKLMRDLRLQDRPSYDEEQALSRIYSIGALIVPDVPGMDLILDVDMRQYMETVEFMVGHAYEGGVLVVGGQRVVSKRYKSGWPVLLERLLVENSRTFEVS
jgi:hypothetical protein